jgi:hypothetical protein
MGSRVATAALLAAIAAASPAVAQQGSPPWLPLPHPAESGKPIIYDPQFAAKADRDKSNGCSPGLQCRLQLLGVIQNNGAVELRATAFRW